MITESSETVTWVAFTNCAFASAGITTAICFWSIPLECGAERAYQALDEGDEKVPSFLYIRPDEQQIVLPRRRLYDMSDRDPEIREREDKDQKQDDESNHVPSILLP